MSTRGLWGFRKNGNSIAVYRHWDSYPEGLGAEFTGFLKKNKNKLDRVFGNIEVVDGNSKPTDMQKAYCTEMGWCNTNVSSRSDTDWYCLLRETQDPEKWQEAIDSGNLVYVDNQIDFIKDSLFCEFAYIYDVDNEVLEYYMGFQHEPQEENPYGCTPDEDDYYPSRLMGKLRMAELENMTEDDIVAWMNSFHNEAEDEEY